ncbi:MAG: AraC family transcriptional regulator [Bacteroidota bacterium]
MKPLIQKLPLSEDASFVARTYRTPNFEVPWHQHIEYELILFTEGEGMSFVGNYVGEFEVGDIFFLGCNVPHTFQKRQKDLITSAVVVQFVEDFWGKEFLNMPEGREIRQLFNTSMQGLKLHGESKTLLEPLVKQLEEARGFKRITILCECLSIIAQKEEFTMLSTQEVKQLNAKEKERIDKVFRYTIDTFQKPITLTYVAEIAGMSVPAFCSYFKKSTKKTYIDFLNEVRIGYACKLLIDSSMNVLEICYESGFNTLANFNKQFLKIKKLPPSQYRKQFANSVGNIR